MVKREVNLVGRIELSTHDLRRDFLKGFEIAVNSLINKNIAISQVKNLANCGGLTQTMNDLEGSERLPCSRGHDEEDTLLATSDCLKRAIDCNALVIPGAVTAVLLVIRGSYDFLAIWILKTFGLGIARPEFIGGRKLIHS